MVKTLTSLGGIVIIFCINACSSRVDVNLVKEGQVDIVDKMVIITTISGERAYVAVTEQNDNKIKSKFAEIDILSIKEIEMDSTAKSICLWSLVTTVVVVVMLAL